MLAIGVLGPLTVSIDDRPVDLGSPKLRVLLVTLALAAGKPVPVDRLGAALWDDDDLPDHLRRAVQTYVTRLRGVLGPGAIVTEPVGYRLDVDPDRVDALRFVRLLDPSGPGPGPDGERGRLDAALALWRGDPFDGAWSGRWDRLRDELVERYLAAVERRVDLDLLEGRHGDVVPQLRQLTGTHPLREPLWERLLTALAASGRRAEALASYESVRRHLAAELGTDPGPALQQIFGDLLTEARPAPSLPSAPAVVPRQLPAEVSGFTGRTVELAELQALVHDGDRPAGAVVIAVIAGMAGVGKTALAVHWAHRAADAFVDGQLYLDLQGHSPAGSPTDPLQALAGFLRSLGVAPSEIPTGVEHAAALYRSLVAGRRILVVLDNASGAEQVRPLLPGSPTCMVLVTSRDRLSGLVATHGARRLTLDALPPDDALALLREALGAERVVAEPEAARDLAGACAFLPLALRIAAANLLGRPEQTLTGYLAELSADDRLGGLSVAGEPDIAVQLAFDISYRRLAPAARRLFRLAACAPGVDVSESAVAAMADVPPEVAAGLLAELANAHLVESRGAGPVGLHDLLRRYGRERVDREDGPSERAAALDRLFDHYLHGVDVAARRLYPDMLRLPVPAVADPTIRLDGHADAMDWLDTERAGLVAAVEYAAGHGFRRAAWLLTDALRGYFWLRRYSADWLATAHAGLAAATDADDGHAQVAARLSFANAYHATGRHEEAIENYTAAHDLAARAGWLDAQAACLTNLGGLHEQRGNLRQAADHLTRALTLNRQLGRLGGQATGLLNLGVLLATLGSLRESADHHAQALAMYRQLGSRDGEAFAFVNLGNLHRELGELEVAHRYLTQALLIVREVGDRNGQASVMRELALVHDEAGRDADALECAEAALALAGDTGDRYAEVRARNALGSVHLSGSRVAEAASVFGQALDLAREIGTPAAEATAQLGLAAVDQVAGRYGDARDGARRVLELAVHGGMRVLEGQARAALAEALLALDRRSEAVDHARQALQSHRETGHRLGEARALRLLGSVARDDGDLEAAECRWQEALELFTDICSPEADKTHELLDTLDLRTNPS